MRHLLDYLVDFFIIGLFLYTRVLPHKDKISKEYKGIFNFFNAVFAPILNLSRRYIKPVQVGTGLSVDMTPIILLVLFLILANIF